jgi:hypothetical protein
MWQQRLFRYGDGITPVMHKKHRIEISKNAAGKHVANLK